jgi:3-phenylpropionate/trans-cinnamate dioxygenase ferredoxin reductase component
MSGDPFVIVGSGLAGATAAAQLRKEGHDGPLMLIGEEGERPYERPPLSKEYLREPSDSTRPYVHGPSFYADQDIELRTGTRVVALDPVTRTVTTGDAERIRYERLLLTTGASPRRLAVPGADLDGVLTLRDLTDAEAIHVRASIARSIVVVGGGWVGSEVAASLRQLDRDVTLVVPGTVPLERALGPEVGAVYRDLHLAHGVRIVPGQRVTALLGERVVAAIETDAGQRIDADLVVVGIGAEPRTRLASDAGLEVADGIVVDERLRTSAPDVWAAGDVASAWHPILGERIRVEHWDNARRQGRTAARNMLGMDEPYTRLPYLYSDQFDLSMEYVGHAPTWDRVVLRGDPAGGAFLAFWLRDGLLVAGMNANVPKVSERIRALITAGLPIDPVRLADAAVPLEVLQPVAMRRPAV